MDAVLEVVERERKKKKQIGGGIYQRREANKLALDFPFLGPLLLLFFLFSFVDGNKLINKQKDGTCDCEDSWLEPV